MLSLHATLARQLQRPAKPSRCRRLATKHIFCWRLQDAALNMASTTEVKSSKPVSSQADTPSFASSAKQFTESIRTIYAQRGRPFPPPRLVRHATICRSNATCLHLHRRRSSDLPAYKRIRSFGRNYHSASSPPSTVCFLRLELQKRVHELCIVASRNQVHCAT